MLTLLLICLADQLREDGITTEILEAEIAGGNKYRKKIANQLRPWEPEEDLKLLVLKLEKLTLSEAAREFNRDLPQEQQRSENSIEIRWARLRQKRLTIASLRAEIARRNGILNNE